MNKQDATLEQQKKFTTGALKTKESPLFKEKKSNLSSVLLSFMVSFEGRSRVREKEREREREIERDSEIEREREKEREGWREREGGRERN